MKNCYYLNLIKRMALVVLLGMVVFGCAPEEPPQLKAVVSKLEVTLEESPSVDTACVAKDMDTIVDKGVPMMSKGKKGGQSPQETGSEEDSDQYAAILEVTERMKVGGKGTAIVSIGREDCIKRKANQGMVRDTAFFYDPKAYVLIIPHADSCVFTPESVFMEVYEKGSSATFSITPKKADSIEVSAELLFYDDEKCSHLPKHDNTQVLKVKVSVDFWGFIWGTVWKFFKDFWGAFVALVFGALLFVVRKYIKKKTGYSDDVKEKIFGGKKAEETEDQKEIPEASQKALEEGNDEVTETKDEMPNKEES